MRVPPGSPFAAALLLAACAVAQEPPPQANPAQPAGAPIAIVPVDASTNVTGALQITGNRAIIATTGTVTSGDKTTEVVLPHRGVLRVCASTSVKLAADSSAPAGETPGLLMALDHGALETSFATGRDSDVLLTPDFRILIAGPGGSDVKVRLGQNGDTCVDNAAGSGGTAAYVLVSSVFDGGAYRVQPGQRVMFQHGSLQEVVDQEKEPCGCPPAPRPGSNDFPLAQSAGLAPLSPPSPAPAAKPAAPVDQALVYQAPAQPSPSPAAATTAAPVAAQPAASSAAGSAPPHKKAGFFHRIGSFFRRVFGAE